MYIIVSVTKPLLFGYNLLGPGRKSKSETQSVFSQQEKKHTSIGMLIWSSALHFT